MIRKHAVRLTDKQLEFLDQFLIAAVESRAANADDGRTLRQISCQVHKLWAKRDRPAPVRYEKLFPPMPI
jgi:hypothetical protein